jgi:hypothetical protein
MKIADYDLRLGPPNADRLLALSGQRPAAMANLLEGPLIASTVAAAVLACATGEDLPTQHDLAVAIEADGVDQVRSEIRKKYAAAAAPAPKDEGVSAKAKA